jgi:hypothetical protein
MADMLKLIGSLGGLIFVCFSTSISSALEKLSQERPSTALVGTPLLMRVLCDISQEIDVWTVIFIKADTRRSSSKFLCLWARVSLALPLCTSFAQQSEQSRHLLLFTEQDDDEQIQLQWEVCSHLRVFL